MEYPDRKPIRNPKHDYSKSATYFITTNTRGGAWLFGEIKRKGMILNDLGNAVHLFWMEIPNHFPQVEIDEFIVMPNHIHGILRITDSPKTIIDPNSTDWIYPVCDNSNRPYTPNHFGAQQKASVGIIVGQFKSAVTRWARKNGHGGIFDWLPRYNDRIIRNENELAAIRNYIRNNPSKWIEKYGTTD